MTLYDCTSYKDALKLLVEERKQLRKSVTFEAMAKYCGIQKTYLSKVLSQKGNLSLDQLALAGEYLKLNTFESQFLENLYLQNTTIVQARLAKYQQALEKARREILKSENSLQAETHPAFIQEMTEKYYLDPYYQLIHIFLTIDRFNKQPSLIRERLGLSENKFNVYIDDLLNWKIVEFKNSSFKVLKNNLHLSKDSNLTSAFQNFARQSSMSRMNQLESQDYYSFSAIISCDEKTKDKIQKKFLEFLKQCQTDVSKSPSQEVYQINFDLLKWS